MQMIRSAITSSPSSLPCSDTEAAESPPLCFHSSSSRRSLALCWMHPPGLVEDEDEVTKLSTTLTTCQTHKLGFQRTQYKDCVIIITITDIIITNLGSQKTCYKARGRRPPSRSPLFASRPGCGDFVTLARFGLGFVKI